jgi:succinate dehydrogenase / fumarate reductase membrane anchor subunit
MSLRSPLGRVLGLGAAHDGVHHWWVQRLTAVALIPLGIWFLISLLRLPASDYESVVAWIAGGWTSFLLILFLLVATWHSSLGMSVVIEDYVHTKSRKAFLLIFSRFAHALAGAAAIFAVLKVAFGSAA